MLYIQGKKERLETRVIEINFFVSHDTINTND